MIEHFRSITLSKSGDNEVAIAQGESGRAPTQENFQIAEQFRGGDRARAEQAFVESAPRDGRQFLLVGCPTSALSGNARLRCRIDVSASSGVADNRKMDATDAGGFLRGGTSQRLSCEAGAQKIRAFRQS